MDRPVAALAAVLDVADADGRRASGRRDLDALQRVGLVGRDAVAGEVAALAEVRLTRDEQALVFDGVDIALGGHDVSVHWDDVAAYATTLPTDSITLRFLTPTRVKYQQAYVVQPAFHVLMRALLRRLSALLLFHCGTAFTGDPRALIAAAEQVVTTRSNVRWVDWERFSGRQRQRMILGGFVGDITYQGDLTPFRELLAAGMLVHVGKAAVFGHGRYQVVEE